MAKDMRHDSGMFAPDCDVVVGAQYGDEGKGMVSKLLADRAQAAGRGYAWTARVGAQNAEHRLVHGACEFCARILPSASAYRDGIVALLGAGHCFRPEQLERECVHLGIGPERVYVDPQAMWLREEHAMSNIVIGNDRGTTGWGVGAAIAEKVRRKPGTKLVGDCDALRSFLPPGHICSISDMIDKIAGPGLVEGSQGCMLSLNHGHYPYCTAKDITASAICGELGICHKRVRHIYGVVRLVQMRVCGPSGPVEGGRELSYDDVEQATGLRIPQHKRLQGDTMRWSAGSGTDNAEEERLFELSLDELRVSHRLNGFDFLAVTFADFHRRGNYRVTTWDGLHPDTQRAVGAIESATGCPVVLVRTGQGEHDNIWRGSHATL